MSSKFPIKPEPKRQHDPVFWTYYVLRNGLILSQWQLDYFVKEGLLKADDPGITKHVVTWEEMQKNYV